MNLAPLAALIDDLRFIAGHAEPGGPIQLLVNDAAQMVEDATVMLWERRCPHCAGQLPPIPVTKPRKVSPRFPADALFRLVRVDGEPISVSELARRMGKDRSLVKRWVDDGFTRDAADEAATRCNFHPENVWPGWSEAEAVSV